jgi:molybdate transport system substrate-binding protein
VPVLAFLFSILASTTLAAEATVAVAANFLTPAREIVARFELESEHRIRLVSGSSGLIYAQISQGAPFDIFMSADTTRPDALEDDGLVVARRTYARGRLVLWGSDANSDDDIGRVTRAFAIANPDVAPYGAAAIEVLDTLGLAPPLVYGENVAQAFAMIATGNAEMGLVAAGFVPAGEGWPVPAEFHAPIKQDAVHDRLDTSHHHAFARRDFHGHPARDCFAARVVVGQHRVAPQAGD